MGAATNMKIVVANSVGKIDDDTHVILFPSRCDYAGDTHWFSYYPYELAYLSTFLKRELSNDEVIMVDGNHEELGSDEYIERLLPLEPDVLVTECSALTYQSMTRVMQGIDCMSILTGPYGMYNPDRAKKDGWNHVIVGEFEERVLDIINGEKPRWGLVDINNLPWPEDEDISRINYTESNNIDSGIVQLFPTRGCPLSCTYCVAPMYYGGHGKSHKSHRTRNVEDVYNEIEYLVDKYSGQGFQGCFFTEETHNANVKWLRSFCQGLIDRELDGLRHDAMCGYWTFNEDIIKLMSQAGYRQIRVGIESTSEKVGKAIHKVVFKDKLVKVLEWCREYGIATLGYTIVGAQGSSYDADIRTLAALIELHQKDLLNTWQHTTATPQPGTPFHAEVEESGVLKSTDLDKYDWRSPVISWPDYPAEDILKARSLYTAVSRKLKGIS